MQHPSLPAALVLSDRRMCLAALLFGLACVSAGAQGITLTLRTERPELVMGEPLLVEVTALNNSGRDVLIRNDWESPNRFLIAPDGTRTPLVPPAHVGDWGYFLRKIAVGTKESLYFVVPEIANVKRPGQYRLVMEYEDLNASGEVAFVVKPYDQGALRARASQLYQSATATQLSVYRPGASARHADYDLGDSALAAVDPTVAKPFLCNLMKLNSPTAAIPRLEQIGDEESVQCLIDAFPAAKGDLRDLLDGTLVRLLRTLPDGETKDNVKRALGRRP